jgi:hypothetical protein
MNEVKQSQACDSRNAATSAQRSSARWRACCLTFLRSEHLDSAGLIANLIKLRIVPTSLDQPQPKHTAGSGESQSFSNTALST